MITKPPALGESESWEDEPVVVTFMAKLEHLAGSGRVLRSLVLSLGKGAREAESDPPVPCHTIQGALVNT
eukprot:scaffold2482_cov134-Pinguiococcus_pyrenoidosus.AAC.2